jgi:hypothetical protein
MHLRVNLLPMVSYEHTLNTHKHTHTHTHNAHTHTHRS